MSEIYFNVTSFYNKVYLFLNITCDNQRPYTFHLLQTSKIYIKGTGV